MKLVAAWRITTACVCTDSGGSWNVGKGAFNPSRFVSSQLGTTHQYEFGRMEGADLAPSQLGLDPLLLELEA